MWETYIKIKRKLFPNMHIENYWIKPHYEKMGIKPKREFSPKLWEARITKS